MAGACLEIACRCRVCGALFAKTKVLKPKSINGLGVRVCGLGFRGTDNSVSALGL